MYRNTLILLLVVMLMGIACAAVSESKIQPSPKAGVNKQSLEYQLPRMPAELRQIFEEYEKNKPFEPVAAVVMDGSELQQFGAYMKAQEDLKLKKTLYHY